MGVVRPQGGDPKKTTQYHVGQRPVGLLSKTAWGSAWRPARHRDAGSHQCGQKARRPHFPLRPGRTRDHATGLAVHSVLQEKHVGLVADRGRVRHQARERRVVAGIEKAGRVVGNDAGIGQGSSYVENGVDRRAGSLFGGEDLAGRRQDHRLGGGSRTRGRH